MDKRFDLGLVIATSDEFDFARELIPFGESIKDGIDYFYAFRVPGTDRRGIAVVLFEMGIGAAVGATTSFLSRFDVSVLAMVGIAGALHDDLLLGDVVVASAVDEYLYAAKARPGTDKDAFELESGGNSWQLDRRMRNFVNHFRYADNGSEYRRWRAAAAARGPAIDAAASCGTALSRGEPDYFLKPIATGDVVVAAEGFSSWIRRGNRLRGAVEMEAGGVARATWADRTTDFLVVRGISDFADDRKTLLDRTVESGQAGVWRRRATQNALDLLIRLVADPDFPWREKPVPTPGVAERLRSYRSQATTMAAVSAELASLAPPAPSSSDSTAPTGVGGDGHVDPHGGNPHGMPQHGHGHPPLDEGGHVDDGSGDRDGDSYDSHGSYDSHAADGWGGTGADGGADDGSAGVGGI